MTPQIAYMILFSLVLRSVCVRNKRFLDSPFPPLPLKVAFVVLGLVNSVDEGKLPEPQKCPLLCFNSLIFSLIILSVAYRTVGVERLQ